MRDRLDSALRQYRPAVVAVFTDTDDEATIIRPTGSRGRWLRVLQSVPRDARRAELRDESGAVLLGLDLDGAPPATMAPPPAAPSGDLERLLQLMLRAQESAVDRQSKQLADVTSGYRELAQLVVSRLSALERTYSDVLRSAYEATAMAAAADSAGKDTSTAADALVTQLAPLAASKLMSSMNGAK